MLISDVKESPGVRTNAYSSVAKDYKGALTKNVCFSWDKFFFASVFNFYYYVIKVFHGHCFYVDIFL